MSRGEDLRERGSGTALFRLQSKDLVLVDRIIKLHVLLLRHDYHTRVNLIFVLVFNILLNGNISYDDDDDEDEDYGEDEDDGELTELLGCCDADGRGVPHDKMNARRPSQQDQYHHQQLHNHHHPYSCF